MLRIFGRQAMRVADDIVDIDVLVEVS